MKKRTLIELCIKEGWELSANGEKIVIHGAEFNINHPFNIYMKMYREASSAADRLHYLKRGHDLLWPDDIITNNYWMDDMFLSHCEEWKEVVWAGGAGLGKSTAAAKLAYLFWASDPTNNAVLVASTTLDSLESRIWGYIVKLVERITIPLPHKILTAKPPKILYPGSKQKIHGIFATAIKTGDVDKVLSTVIGRHPNKRFLVILDEATDIDATVLSAIPNWEQGVEFFQLIAIGNSKDKSDLHGAMATPAEGWKSVDPTVNERWTTERGGICLYFNPFNSPAIHEKDPVKKLALSKFLITNDKIRDKASKYGTDSESYYRFVLGYWRGSSSARTIFTREFADQCLLNVPVEWSGRAASYMVAGLDPSMSSKGCVFRAAMLSYDVEGLRILDFRGGDYLHYIELNTKSSEAPEIQLVNQLKYLLEFYKVPLSRFAFDATGVGRLLGGYIQKVMFSLESPIKIMNTRGVAGKETAREDGNLVTITPYDLWLGVAKLMQTTQIRGLDDKTIEQFTSRQIIQKGGKDALEDKVTYTARMSAINPSNAHSPDEADTTSLVVQAAIRGANFEPNQRIDLNLGYSFSQKYNAFISAHEAEALMLEEQRRVPVKRRVSANFSSSIEDLAYKKGH